MQHFIVWVSLLVTMYESKPEIDSVYRYRCMFGARQKTIVLSLTMSDSRHARLQRGVLAMFKSLKVHQWSCLKSPLLLNLVTGHDSAASGNLLAGMLAQFERSGDAVQHL